MPIFVSDLQGWVPPADVFVALHLKDENAFWLDREIHATERFSILGASARVFSESSAVVDFLKSQLISENEESLDLPFEFRPGLVGFLAYDGESKFLHIDRAMVFDHDHKAMYFIGDFAQQKDFDSWLHAALLRLTLCGGELAAYRLSNEALTAHRAMVRHSSEQYLRLIENAQAHIRNNIFHARDNLWYAKTSHHPDQRVATCAIGQALPAAQSASSSYQRAQSMGHITGHRVYCALCAGGTR